MSRPSVCILYGVCEGPRIASRLIRALTTAGFGMTRNAAEADIIIAHSGGCFALPQTHRATMVLLVGLPCWPGKSTLKSTQQKIWLDMRSSSHDPARWLLKTFWNSIYFWNMRNNYAMFRGQRRQAHRSIAHAVLVRNKDDVTCTPNHAHFRFKHSPPLVSLPGQHDDIWLHPKSYINLIRQYYG